MEINKMKINKKEELNWILHMLQKDCGGGTWGKEDEDVYLLEHIIRFKEYSRRDVEEWGKEDAGGELRGILNKIDDVLHVRLLRSAAAGKVDKGIAQRRLSAKYEYNDKVGVDLTSKGEKLESVVFYIPDNGRDAVKENG